MATTSADPDRDDASRRSAAPADGPHVPWVEPVARAGYTAKGFVYAVIGLLAFRAAVGWGGGTAGTREALREVAGGPFGGTLVSLLGVGLAAYVVWRLVQAFLDPEHRHEDGGAKRVAMRVFYFGSAVIYGALAYSALELVMDVLGSGAGGGGGAGGEGTVRLFGSSWGIWLVGVFGVGMVARGMLQFFKAYTGSFRDRIRSFDLGPARSGWVLTACRVGLTARGIIFAIIGGFLVQAALRADPSEARGTEGALQFLQDQPWLLGAVGAGLVGYAVYQWVKARYRLIGVED